VLLACVLAGEAGRELVEDPDAFLVALGVGGVVGQVLGAEGAGFGLRQSSLVLRLLVLGDVLLVEQELGPVEIPPSSRAAMAAAGRPSEPKVSSSPSPSTALGGGPNPSSSSSSSSSRLRVSSLIPFSTSKVGGREALGLFRPRAGARLSDGRFGVENWTGRTRTIIVWASSSSTTLETVSSTSSSSTSPLRRRFLRRLAFVTCFWSRKILTRAFSFWGSRTCALSSARRSLRLSGISSS
jgi:hypothetical protein